MSYAVDKNILIWKKSLVCDNEFSCILASLHRNCVGMFLSKYRLPSHFRATEIKRHYVETSLMTALPAVKLTANNAQEDPMPY